VACGDRNSNREILDQLKRMFPDAKSHDAPWRAGDVMHTQADITKARENLGYVPIVRFWDGLDRTVQWYEENWDAIKEMSGGKRG
jgi:nucleoside-diphosphate-sugar epimerase